MLKTTDLSSLEAILSTLPEENSIRFVSKKPNAIKTYASKMAEGKKYPYAMLSNVFLNCPAFQKLGFKGKVEQLSHFEGFPLLSIVQKFENGVERFTEAMVGWGESESQIKQIKDYEIYPPCTCQKAQELGICNKTNPEACMKSVNGVSPSPIRFATRPINPQKHTDKIVDKYFGGKNE